MLGLPDSNQGSFDNRIVDIQRSSVNAKKLSDKSIEVEEIKRGNATALEICLQASKLKLRSKDEDEKTPVHTALLGEQHNVWVNLKVDKSNQSLNSVGSSPSHLNFDASNRMQYTQLLQSVDRQGSSQGERTTLDR